MGSRHHAVLALVSQGYPPPQDTFLRVTHPSAAPYCYGARLACVRHAASVRSEPGSNSQVHLKPHGYETPNEQTQRSHVTLNYCSTHSQKYISASCPQPMQSPARPQRTTPPTYPFHSLVQMQFSRSTTNKTLRALTGTKPFAGSEWRPGDRGETLI